ncbi:MAG: hypothetical protein WCJ56_06615 [bacterium]
MKQDSRHNTKTKRGYALLIELLVVVVLVIGLFAWYTNSQTAALKQSKLLEETGVVQNDGTSATAGAPKTIYGQAVQASKGDVCRNYLGQLREMVKMDAADGKFPASLGEISGAQSINKCPVSKEPYVYNPATGEVHCITPGHEKF